MNKKILYILLILFVSLNVFLLIKIQQENNIQVRQSSNSEHLHNTDSIENLHAYINLLRGRILLQAKYAKIGINGFPKVMDTVGHESDLREVIKGNENLIFFFTYKQCYSCIDRAIPYLEKLAEKVGYDKVILLGDLYEQRDILSFKAKYRSKLRIYSIQGTAINSDAKDLNYPFMFLLDRNLNARSMFFSEKDLPQVTADFMDEMVIHFQSH